MTVKETHTRSLAKGVSWRFVGSADTTFLSWIFTRNIHQSLGIGGIEFCTKVLLYYLHERVWLRIPWLLHTKTTDQGILQHDHHLRSVAKGVSWRLLAMIDTVLIAWLITGNVKKALTIGVAEVITKIFLYYLHERAWQKLTIGRGRQTTAGLVAEVEPPTP